MPYNIRFVIVALCLLMAACSPTEWNEKLSTPQDRAVSLKFITGLRSGNVDSLKADIEPELFTLTRSQISSANSIISARGDPELVTVNANSFSNNGVTEVTKALNYQYGSGQKWVVFQVVLRETNKVPLVIGWHATPALMKPTAAGDFSFAGKGFVNYLWILLMLVSTFTIMAALTIAAKSKGLRRRWLWVVGSLFGVCQFILNWATGAWSVRPIYFSILGSGFVKASPFDAWVMTFSIPVVAIIFLVKRKSLLPKPDEEFR